MKKTITHNKNGGDGTFLGGTGCDTGIGIGCDTGMGNKSSDIICSDVVSSDAIGSIKDTEVGV